MKDPNGTYLSNMVREGILTREQALKRANSEGKVSQDRIKEVCNIDLPVDSFNSLRRPLANSTMKSTYGWADIYLATNMHDTIP